MIKMDSLVMELDKFTKLERKLKDGKNQLKVLSQGTKFEVSNIGRFVCHVSSSAIIRAVRSDIRGVYIECAEQVELLRKMGVDCRDEFRGVYGE